MREHSHPLDVLEMDELSFGHDRPCALIGFICQAGPALISAVEASAHGTSRQMPERNPVDKTLRALSWLAETAQPQVGVRQLAAAMNIAPSSAHRILMALSEAGFVRQDGRTQRYALGNEFFRLSQLAAAKAPVGQASLAAMRRLVDACGESALLCIYDERRRQVTFAAAVNAARTGPPGPGGQGLELNRWLPVRTGASGLAVLAYLDEGEAHGIVQRPQAPACGGRNAFDPERFRGEMAAVRRQGYALAPCQWISGAMGLAAPIFGGGGKVMGNVCVTIPRERARSGGMERLIGATLGCARDVTRRMNAGR
jgi:DNA-binding IclR family transcriptional regulator